MKTLILSILSLMARIKVTTSFGHGHRRWWSSRFNRHRIFGGEEIERHEFPFLINVVKRGTQGSCGGSLNTPDVVLTAAHCLLDQPFDSRIIKAGDHRRVQIDITERSRRVRRFIPHESYVPGIFANDIALIKFESPFRLVTGVIGTVPLVASFSVPTSMAIIVGWGKTEIDGGMSNMPNKLTVAFVDRMKRIPWLAPGDMCFGGVQSKGICNGDSGSPLMCGEVQCGIAVYVLGCWMGYPDVFTDVAYFADWKWKCLNLEFE